MYVNYICTNIILMASYCLWLKIKLCKSPQAIQRSLIHAEKLDIIHYCVICISAKSSLNRRQISSSALLSYNKLHIINAGASQPMMFHLVYKEKHCHYIIYSPSGQLKKVWSYSEKYQPIFFQTKVYWAVHHLMLRVIYRHSIYTHTR